MSLESESEKLLKQQVKNPVEYVGRRYNWVPLPLPRFWWITFWKEKWKNYGRYDHIQKGSAGYEEARYETSFIYHRSLSNEDIERIKNEVKNL